MPLSSPLHERMAGVLRAKFAQNDDLREVLVALGDAKIIECATTDSAVNRHWGEVNGVGKNMLGVLLMRIRDELRVTGTRACAWCGGEEVARRTCKNGWFQNRRGEWFCCRSHRDQSNRALRRFVDETRG